MCIEPLPQAGGGGVGKLCLHTSNKLLFAVKKFRPSIILCSVIFDLRLFAVWLYSNLGYSTFCNFRRLVILLSFILPSVTFDVQSFRCSVILRSVILPFVIPIQFFCRSVLLRSVSRRSVAQSDQTIRSPRGKCRETAVIVEYPGRFKDISEMALKHISEDKLGSFYIN